MKSKSALFRSAIEILKIGYNAEIQSTIVTVAIRRRAEAEKAECNERNSAMKVLTDVDEFVTALSI